MPMRKPPARKLRPDRRITVIIPAAYRDWIDVDLAAGWTISGIVVAALSLAYPNAEKGPVKDVVTRRNGRKATPKQ